MRVVGVADLKANLSKQLAAVKAGEEVIVTERGGPIARIVPITTAEVPERLKRLAQRGLVKLPTAPPGDHTPRLADPEERLLRALLEEREGGL